LGQNSSVQDCSCGHIGPSKEITIAFLLGP